MLVLASLCFGLGRSVVELLELDSGEVVDRPVGALGVVMLVAELQPRMRREWASKTNAT